MKVLYLANPLRSGTGGDRRSFEVLRRIGSIGVEPVIVVDDFVWQKMKRSGDTQFSPKQTIYTIKRPNVVYDKLFKSASRAALDYFSIFKTANQIAQIAKQEQVEFIVSHHEKIDFLLEAYLAAKKRHLPWTCLFQLPLFPPYASTEWRRIGSVRRSYLFALYAPLYGLIKKAAQSTTLLAVSPSIEDEIKIYLPDWKSKMQVLRPGVGVTNDKIRQIAPSKEQIDAIFFSRLAPEKGIFDLPKIASEMAKEKPDLRIVVVGRFESPIIKNAFKKAVQDSQVAKNLVYKGFVEEEALYSFLKAAKVLIYPSKHDAFPLVVLETLAAGTRVVAYDIPAIRVNFPSDIVKTVPVGDWKSMAAEALKIMNDDKLGKTVSGKALAFASNFSWDRVALEERQAYDKILNQKNST